jgi:purine-binding chemotaxis protein CheW
MNTSSVFENAQDHVTVDIGPQRFGIDVLKVRDVFEPTGLTIVPSAPKEVAGVLNLRGYIVTAIDGRVRLGMPDRGEDDPTPMAVSVERNGEMFGLLVDRVGETIPLTQKTYESNPANMDSRWAGVAAGVHRLETGLLVLLDIDRVLRLEQSEQGA